MATRDELHRRVDDLTEPEVANARIVLIDSVDPETSVRAMLERHGEEALGPEDFDRHFSALPSDEEG